MSQNRPLVMYHGFTSKEAARKKQGKINDTSVLYGSMLTAARQAFSRSPRSKYVYVYQMKPIPRKTGWYEYDPEYCVMYVVERDGTVIKHLTLDEAIVESGGFKAYYDRRRSYRSQSRIRGQIHNA